jgi:L-amino acid N-acyltransferase YncA
MVAADWPAVCSIYEEGLATRNATFETSPPDWEGWDAARRPDCRLVARFDRQVVGWAALSPYSSRFAYRGVAEVSVYVAATARGQGVGRALLRALIESAEAAGVWTLQAGIFPENETSIRLHAAEGFRVVGRRERIGQLDGEWRDVVLMERRSASVG